MLTIRIKITRSTAGYLYLSYETVRSEIMSNESEHFTFASEAEIEDLGGGLKRQMLGYNHELMAVKVIFDKGAIGYNHAFLELI